MSEFNESFKRGRTNLKREDEMKTIGMVALFAILVLQNVWLSQNIIQNGGFENDFSGWVPVDSVNISTAVVHSGAKSFMASDPAKNRSSIITLQSGTAHTKMVKGYRAEYSCTG